MEVQVQKLNPAAIMPTYAHDTDAGFDLYALEEVTLAPGEKASVGTGLAVGVPEGYVGLIWDKSGIAHKHGIKTLGGVIDSGYSGEVFVGVTNLGSEPYTFTAGHKVAQMLIQPIIQAELREVETVAAGTRGEGRFGSTGK